ncbi:MAG: FMN-binding protein [Planctomycetota bacterium]|nr:FMN-binding protein [Planctomycetota bacterium]
MVRRMGMLLAALVFAASTEAATNAAPAPKTITKAEADALIQREGSQPPPWWNSVQLNYPKTLDLSQMVYSGGGWDANKHINHYFWSIVNENPGKWKEGVKFASFLMTCNSPDPQKEKYGLMQMAHLYCDCLQDYARAAYCMIKRGDTASERLAACYFQLGCKDAAIEILKKYGFDDTRHGTVIKLWADMGEYDTALKLAEEKAKNGSADIAYLMAGDTCRLAGRYKEALAYYQKALAVPAGQAGRDLKFSKSRAQNSIDAVKVYELLDLGRIPDGKYKDSAQGYSSLVTVEVTVASRRIAAVNVVSHQEKQYYGSLAEMPKRILERQGIKGVDTFSSATMTSEAIVNATGKALANGMK